MKMFPPVNSILTVADRSRRQSRLFHRGRHIHYEVLSKIGETGHTVGRKKRANIALSSHTTRKAESLCVMCYQWLASYGGLASYLYMYYVDVEGSGLPVL